MRNRRELYELITKGEIKFDASWDTRTPDCIDFVKRLLIRDYKQRMTAKQALKHAWLAGNYKVEYV
jgi:serine/threonine protein kinase